MLFARLHGRTHSGESRNPGFLSTNWVPAFAGATVSGQEGFFEARKND
jgi:hypothetical protein